MLTLAQGVVREVFLAVGPFGFYRVLPAGVLLVIVAAAVKIYLDAKK